MKRLLALASRAKIIIGDGLIWQRFLRFHFFALLKVDFIVKSP
jgi:hypothetical protein